MKIFISRELSLDSPFYKILPTEKVQLFGESLIAFEQVKFEAIPEVDWCFFSSRNAVKFFTDGLFIKSCHGLFSFQVNETISITWDFLTSWKPS